MFYKEVFLCTYCVINAGHSIRSQSSSPGYTILFSKPMVRITFPIKSFHDFLFYFFQGYSSIQGDDKTIGNLSLRQAQHVFLSLRYFLFLSFVSCLIYILTNGRCFKSSFVLLSSVSYYVSELNQACWSNSPFYWFLSHHTKLNAPMTFRASWIVNFILFLLEWAK